MHRLDDTLDLFFVLNLPSFIFLWTFLRQHELVFLSISDISTDLDMRVISPFFLNLISTIFYLDFSLRFHLNLLSDELLHPYFIHSFGYWEQSVGNPSYVCILSLEVR